MGDTLSIKLRDVPAYFGYDLSNDMLTGNAATDTGAYEIVGIYDYRELYQRTVTRNFTYIPASVVPEGFQGASPETVNTERFYFQMEDIVPPSAAPLPWPGAVSFVLTSPDEEARFMAETRVDLEHMGFRASFLDNGLEDFRATAGPMRQSSLYNALTYSAILLVAFALAAFVYFFLRRRELAIVRALGVPVRNCVKQVSLPLGLVGLPGVLIGGTLGWRYTLANAAKTLEALAEFGDGSVSALPVYWLILLWASAVALFLALTVGSAAVLARRPVLEQMQGGAPVKQKAVPAGTVPQMSAMTTAERAVVRAYAPAPVTVRRKGGLNAGHTLRFVWRHIVRSRVKTALTVILAAGFTVGLAAIQLFIVNSQERIDWLYDNTAVDAKLVRTGEYSGASIRRDTIASLEESGYVTDVYLEADTSAGTGLYAYGGEWSERVRLVTEEEQTRLPVLAFEDADAFLSHIGSGSGVTITYHEGWDASLFAQKWTGAYDPEKPFPVILPKAVYDQYGLEPGDLIVVLCRSIRPCEAAGYYEGAVTGDSESPILLPLTAAQTMASGRISYSKAHMTLDRALNRQLDTFVETVESIAAVQGIATLRAAIWDEELRQAVVPLERSITLMQVLYPVTLVLSLLAAAGVSVLFVMLSAKEAAILRVQGTTRFRTVLMLGLQQVFTCFAGLLMGLIGILLYIGGTRPDLLAGLAPGAALCAGLYLLAGIAGAAASSTAVTGKNPLEMLQVKE